MSESIRAIAPASIGNLTVGFDILGMALESPYDEVIASFNDERKLRITKIDGDDGKLPLEADKNTAGIAANALLRRLNAKRGVDIHLKKNLPLGSGMGSSGASAVAAVVAVNALMGSPLEKKELLPFLIESEAAASGTAHADNVAPSLLGGITLIRDLESLDVIQLPCPESLHITLVKPEVEVLTKHARMLMGKDIPVNNVVRQTGNLAGFISALYTDDLELLSRSMHDYIAEPVRARLIPGYDLAKRVALDAGALAAGISGSGPTLYALSLSEKMADEIASEFKEVYTDMNFNCFTVVTTLNKEGAKIIK